MIPAQVRNTMKGYLEGFLQGMVDEARESGFEPKKLRPLRVSSKEGDLKPFHESLIPDGILRVSEFERSFSTKLGTTFEECAKLIAASTHRRAERGHRVAGHASPKAIKRIEEVVNAISSGGMRSKYPTLVKEIIALSKSGTGVRRISIADLHIETKTGEELFFEIKSPKPNKGQCLEATARLLQIHAITHEKYPKVKTFYATAYNPYGLKKEDYKHSFAVNYMDIQNEVLVGKEFWDLVGGDGTYEDVLSIYQDVGCRKGPDMIDQLALGY